jgi:hypothetical protein
MRPAQETTRLTSISLVLFVAILSSCSAVDHVPIRLHNWDEPDLVKNANLIVLATTHRVEWEPVAIKVQWNLQPGVRSARLVRLDLQVEQVIRGTLKDVKIPVGYWAADVFTNASALHLPFTNERDIHYLTDDHGIYRYVADIVRSQTEVFSGAHNRATTSTDDTDQLRIAKVLLTPGERINAELFARNLATSTIRSLELVGFMRTLPLLRNLLQYQHPQVMWSTCVQMYSFIGQDSCIDQLASHQLAGSRGQELDTLLATRKRGNVAFARAFLSDPLHTAKQYAVLRGDEGILDFLHLIAQHPDRTLAARALAELQHRAPNTQ